MARNKPHKQKFASKRSLKKQGGKQAAPQKKSSVPKYAKAMTHRGGHESGHKNKVASQAHARKIKKDAAVEKVKCIGTSLGPPRIVGVAPLNESANATAVKHALRGACGLDQGESTPESIWHKEKRLRMTLISDGDGNEQTVLDMAKVADIMVLVLDCSSAVQATLKDANRQANMEDYATTWFGDIGLCITDMTRDLIQCLNSQGCPTPIVVLDGLASFENPAKKAQCIRLHQRYFTDTLPEEVVVLANEVEDTNVCVDNLLRTIQDCKLRQLLWREQHPYILMEDADYDEEAKEFQFSGYLRGNQLDANQLIHLTNHGTFQIKYIVRSDDPKPFKERQYSNDPVMDVADEEARESLEETQLNDTYEDDQAWVMENVDPISTRTQTKKKKVPAGVSEYQAAWYDGEEVGSDDEGGNHQHAGNNWEGGNGQIANVGGDDDYDDGVPQIDDDLDAATFRTNMTGETIVKSSDILKHERMTAEERLAEIQALRDASADEMRHPDEVDTPHSIPARHRFAQYRGLKSFNTSAWDPNENLPPNYAKIFKLQGYSRLRESCIREHGESAAPVGSWVTIVLVNVPSSVWDKGTDIMIASGQLPHEQKWSVVHFQIRRSTEFSEPIASKTTMLAHIGFRKFYVQPLFSDVSVGDRTKYSRYFHQEETFKLATFYGPVTYHPSPIVMFEAVSREEELEGAPMRLACYGSAAPPNPDLIILKRTVLTGRIADIFRRSLIVKYMFFNEDDVRWFQPVDLYTRLGKRGKIEKPIGSHGLFRAVFNEQLMQHDVVCMDLYKRVYPEWSTIAYNIAEVIPDDALDGSEDSDDDGEWEDVVEE